MSNNSASEEGPDLPAEGLKQQVETLVDSYNFQLAELYAAISRLEKIVDTVPAGLPEVAAFRREAASTRDYLKKTVDLLEASVASLRSKRSD